MDRSVSLENSRAGLAISQQIGERQLPRRQVHGRRQQSGRFSSAQAARLRLRGPGLARVSSRFSGFFCLPATYMFLPPNSSFFKSFLDREHVRVCVGLNLLIVICGVVLVDLATETAKYVFPKRFESRNLEEALMAGI